MAKRNGTTLSSTMLGNQSNGLENPFVKPSALENSTFVKDGLGVRKPVGNSITDKLVKNASTPQEVDNAIEVGKEVQAEAETNKRIIDVIKSEPVTQIQTAQPEKPMVGSGQALSQTINFDPSQRGVPPMNIEDVQRSLLEQDPFTKNQILEEFNRYAQTKNNPTAPILEGLGVMDYYPDLNKDIAVGSTSTKTFGSGNVYVAQGGLVPYTVINARNKAMEKQAMDTQAKIDGITSKRFVTSEQYQRQYDDAYLEWLNKYIKLAGSNVDLLTDPSTSLGREFLEGSTRWENLYKENKYVDGVVDKVLDQHEKGDYVPPQILKQIDEFRSGRMDMEGYISGKGNVSQIAESMKSYDNMITWADEKIPEFRQSGQITMPIRPDLDLTNPTIAKNAQEALIFKPGQSNDQYISGLRKYYDTNAIEAIVDNAFQQNRFYKGMSEQEEANQKAILTSYIVNSMGEEITLKQDVTANDNMEKARLAQAERRLNWEKEKFERTQDVSFNQMIDDDTKGLTADFIQAVNNNPNLTGVQKKEIIRQKMMQSGFYSEDGSKRIGVQVMEVPLTQQELDKTNIQNRGELNFSYKGKNYKMSDIPAQRKLATGEDKAYWDEWQKVLDETGEGLEFNIDSRFVTPMTVKNGKRYLGEYIDVDSDVYTANIDEASTYIIKDPEGNTVTKSLPARVRVYSNLSNPATIASRDADNTTTSKTAKTGETHRGGGKVTSKTTTTRR